MSKVAASVRLKHKVVAWTAAAALSWSVASSAYHYPHCLSYFNELVGGPRYGQRHLLDSNIDWGQDLLMLRWWLDRRPEQSPISIAYSLPTQLVNPSNHGIANIGPPPVGPPAALPLDKDVGPMPGRYAVFVREMYERERRYEYFQRFQPIDTVGYSVYIYDISLDEANRVRAELGLPPVTESPPSTTSEPANQE